MRCHKLNMFVVAGCLNLKSDGAEQLSKLCDPKRILLLEIDIRRKESLSSMLHTISDFFTENPHMGKLICLK